MDLSAISAVGDEQRMAAQKQKCCQQSENGVSFVFATPRLLLLLLFMHRSTERINYLDYYYYGSGMSAFALHTLFRIYVDARAPLGVSVAVAATTRK